MWNQPNLFTCNLVDYNVIVEFISNFIVHAILTVYLQVSAVYSENSKIKQKTSKSMDTEY